MFHSNWHSNNVLIIVVIPSETMICVSDATSSCSREGADKYDKQVVCVTETTVAIWRTQIC